MTTPRKAPQDRKPKATEDKLQYTLTYGGKTYLSKPVDDHITPGFLRANRRRDEIDAFFTIVEELFDPKALEATVDKMTNDEFRSFMESFYEWMEASRGESTAS